MPRIGQNEIWQVAASSLLSRRPYAVARALPRSSLGKAEVQETYHVRDANILGAGTWFPRRIVVAAPSGSIT